MATPNREQARRCDAELFQKLSHKFRDRNKRGSLGTDAAAHYKTIEQVIFITCIAIKSASL